MKDLVMQTLALQKCKAYTQFPAQEHQGPLEQGGGLHEERRMGTQQCPSWFLPFFHAFAQWEQTSMT